ncbi:hypothetical protein [Candidatus Odyssella acanthamoebae]|uniref:Flagellin n=1 Tax=Candidatus Odyssella acanthamoebae TaxID=91604 RepID=A0A077B2R0_9PROT|nr:hypothetical protein [Candidatus Paracaedibacter acanthamoebae]AIK97290.1 hypothetical protein ID47_11915 [Candidatus Paracaedibacter acanthamoebae]
MTNLPYLSASQYNQSTALRNERSFQAAAAELTSGGIADGYSEVKNVQQFVGQELMLNFVESYKGSAVLNKERMGFVSTQVATMRDIAVELQRQVSQLRSSPLAKPEELSTWCNDKLDQLTSILNGRFDGKYPMSGDASNVPSTKDLRSLPNMGLTDPVDSNLYYLGSTANIKFRADDNTIVETNVRGDNLGVAELIFALRLCITLPAAEKDDRLKRANDLALQAHEDLVVVNGQLDTNIKTLDGVQDSLLQLEQKLTENIKEIGYRTQSEVLNDYVQSKTQVELTRYVTTSLLNSLKDLIQQMPA